MPLPLPKASTMVPWLGLLFLLLLFLMRLLRLRSLWSLAFLTILYRPTLLWLTLSFRQRGVMIKIKGTFLEEYFSKQACLFGSGTSGSVTHLLKLSTTLPPRIPLNHEEFATAMFEEYLIYFQNLPKANKMELFSKATFYTYQAASIFSLVAFGHGDVLAMGNTSKARDTWKGKCEVKTHKCSNF